MQAVDQPYVLHHANCPDGWTGAWIINNWLRSYGYEPKVIGCNYNQIPPNVEGHPVYMVDFCFDDHEQMKWLIKQADSFLLLDHHQTAAGLLEDKSLWTVVHDGQKFGVYDDWAELGDYVGLDRLLETDEARLLVDQSHSGAMLAALYCDYSGIYTDEDGNYDFVNYVEDRDLWHKKLPYTEEVNAAITSYAYTMENWNSIAGTPLEDLIAQGESIQRYRKQLIDFYVSIAQPITFEGYETLIAPCAYAVGSDVAHELAKKCESKFAMYYVDYPGGSRKFGIRSLEDGPDVAAMCEKFGGGGHYHAAGFNGTYTMEIVPKNG